MTYRAANHEYQIWQLITDLLVCPCGTKVSNDSHVFHASMCHFLGPGIVQDTFARGSTGNRAKRAR